VILLNKYLTKEQKASYFDELRKLFLRIKLDKNYTQFSKDLERFYTIFKETLSDKQISKRAKMLNKTLEEAKKILFGDYVDYK